MLSIFKTRKAVEPKDETRKAVEPKDENPIEAACQHTTAVLQEAQALVMQGRIAEIEKEYQSVVSLKAKLLPVEHAATKQLRDRCQVLDNEKLRLNGTLKYGFQYPILDKNVFGWASRPNGENGAALPKLIPFSPYSEKFELASERYRKDEEWEAEKRFRLAHHSDYRSGISAFERLAQDRVPVEIEKFYSYKFASEDHVTTYTFNGLIPQAVKDKLPKFEEKFGRGNVFFLADARNCTATTKIYSPDPLVIGYDKDSGLCFLLDRFDVTPFENWVAREHTSKE